MSHVSFPYLGIEFDINRVAFSLGSFPVYWYGILIALGMLVGITLAQKNAKLVGLKEDDVLDVVLISAVFAVLSGRTFYVLFADDYEIHSVKEFLNLRGGGTAFYGVLIGALLSCLIVCKIKKMPVLPFLDNVGIGFCIAQGIGRWGNFFNQELFGTNTELPWAMYSDTISRYVSRNAARLYSEHGIVLNDAPVHPTFLYESIWCFIGFLLLYRLLRKRRFDGEVFLSYLVWNGIGRACIEHLRTDALFLGRVRISQLVCSLLALIAFIALMMIRSSIKRLNDDEYLMTYAKRLALETEEADESVQSDEVQEGDVILDPENNTHNDDIVPGENTTDEEKTIDEESTVNSLAETTNKEDCDSELDTNEPQ